MLRPRRLCATLIGTMILLGAIAATVCAQGLSAPIDPLRSTMGLSFGVHQLTNESYADFFDESELNSWTLRYDYRLWGPFRVGAALSASGKSRHSEDISLGSEAYPIHFSYSSFQGMGEIYLRSHLPRFLGLRPHASIGALYSRIHVESSGYTQGYDAFWEDYRPAEDVVQFGGGWRGAVGVRLPVWANVALFVEVSQIELEAYGTPTEGDPPIGQWDHSGRRLEFGLLQRF